MEIETNMYLNFVAAAPSSSSAPPEDVSIPENEVNVQTVTTTDGDAGDNLTFEISESPFPVKLIDNEGREWDVFGYGASESNAGKKLESIDHLTGYWFFFPSFFLLLNLEYFLSKQQVMIVNWTDVMMNVKIFTTTQLQSRLSQFMTA